MNKEIYVKDNLVRILKVGDVDYISLTDLARYKNKDNSGDVIIKWMSNKNSFDFYCLWEELFNPKFKLAESREFKITSANQYFVMSPSKLVVKTYATGFVTKRGRYDGGTFAHPDIALEFASWIDSGFKLYLIKEFERLKTLEAKDDNKEWNVRRSLSKTNYKIHTNSIKEKLIPLKNYNKKIIYADEAEVINLSLFGITSKEWKKENPNLKGNIRDYASIIHLIVLSNLEVLNSEMINNGLSQIDRIDKLHNIAMKQLSILYRDNNIKKIEEGME